MNTMKFNDSTTTKKAHVIRRATSDKFGVPLRFVSFSDCMIKARGENIGQMHDCYGNHLGSKASKLNLWLLSDECPVAFTKDELIGLKPHTGGGATLVNQHLTALIKGPPLPAVDRLQRSDLLQRSRHGIDNSTPAGSEPPPHLNRQLKPCKLQSPSTTSPSAFAPPATASAH